MDAPEMERRNMGVQLSVVVLSQSAGMMFGKSNWEPCGWSIVTLYTCVLFWGGRAGRFTGHTCPALYFAAYSTNTTYGCLI